MKERGGGNQKMKNSEKNERKRNGEKMKTKKENGYIGAIANTGTQRVEAPCQKTLPKKAVVKKGGDLRSAKNGR